MGKGVERLFLVTEQDYGQQSESDSQCQQRGTVIGSSGLFLLFHHGIVEFQCLGGSNGVVLEFLE